MRIIVPTICYFFVSLSLAMVRLSSQVDLGLSFELMSDGLAAQLALQGPLRRAL